MYGDDEKNSVTHNVLALHLGGVDSLSRQSGIHGHHLDHYEYVATDSSYETIIAVNKHNPDGSITQFVSSDWKGPIKGVTRQMDRMDCHQQATHTFQTAEDAIDEAMQVGSPNPALPFVHKKGLELIQAEYKSQDEAAAKTTGLAWRPFYQGQCIRRSTMVSAEQWTRPRSRWVEIYSTNAVFRADEGDLGNLSQRHGA